MHDDAGSAEAEFLHGVLGDAQLVACDEAQGIFQLLLVEEAHAALSAAREIPVIGEVEAAAEVFLNLARVG